MKNIDICNILLLRGKILFCTMELYVCRETPCENKEMSV